jgi:hypothetical protein
VKEETLFGVKVMKFNMEMKLFDSKGVEPPSPPATVLRIEV